MNHYLNYASMASALGIPELANVLHQSLADYPKPVKRACDGCKERVKLSGLAMQSFCGHIACFDCLQKTVRADKCVVKGCGASAAPNTIHKVTNLARGNPKAFTREGSKLDAMTEVIKKRIGEDRQVLIFVQNEQIGHSVQSALDRAGITYYSALDKVKGPTGKKMKNDKVNAVNRFKSEDRYKQSKKVNREFNGHWRKCLVLNIFDESAAGV